MQIAMEKPNFHVLPTLFLKNDYKEEVTKEDLKDVFSDLQELEENGTLFTKDVYKEGVIDFKKRQTVVKHSACILPMTATWHAVTVLPVKENIRATALL